MLRKFLLPALPLAFTACLESEEFLTVREDGSARLEWTVKGHLDDLADGYPLPLTGAFRPINDDTSRWLAEVGTGSSAALSQRARELDWRDEEGKQRNQVQLAVAAEFPSVAALPQLTAPDTEPYATAYLRRTTDLQVEPKGDRTVYTLRRTYHGRHATRWGAYSDWWDKVPEEIRKKLEDEVALTEPEWQRIASELSGHFHDMAAHFLRAALVGIYVQGQADLAVDLHQQAVATGAGEVGALVTVERFQQIFTEAQQVSLAKKAARERGEEIPPSDDDPFRDLGNEARQVLRDSLRRSLVAADVEEQVQYAVFERLEWHLTSYDQALDLGDETFVLRVALPGTIVGGNFDEVHGDEARFTFKGKDLLGGDLVLEVISVLETR